MSGTMPDFGPCPKCGAFTEKVYWHPGVAPQPLDMKSRGCHSFDLVKNHDEHLHVYCERCSYQWTEKPKDAR